jgi:hypothetical protein
MTIGHILITTVLILLADVIITKGGSLPLGVATRYRAYLGDLR